MSVTSVNSLRLAFQTKTHFNALLTSQESLGNPGTYKQRFSPRQRIKLHMSVEAKNSINLDDRKVKFCSECGQPTIRVIPKGDEKERDVCSSPSCGNIHYSNPKIVVGAVCLWEDKVLLCKRGIEPCKGKWGFPQGFMELGESTKEGAAREVWEEACAKAEIGPLLAVYYVPGQVQILYLAKLTSPDYDSGQESLEVGLFTWDSITTLDIAFPTVHWALDYAKTVKDSKLFSPQQRKKVIDSNSIHGGSYIEEESTSILPRL